MKTIVFVNPPMTLEARYGVLARAGAMEPPFGLCFLAAATREQGYRTAIIDAETLGLSIDETAREALAFKPDYVGLTATTPAIVSAARVALKIKEGAPSVLTIVGGCHVTAIPEETLEDYPGFDIAAIGEGEKTIVELLSALDEGAGLERVAGLAFRDKDAVRRTPARALVKDLDALPMPAFDLLPRLDRHYGVTAQSVDRFPAASLITSRGCYAKCTFCDTNVTGNTMRGHSAAYVARLMRLVKDRYGIRCVMFEDDNFLAFRKRLKELETVLRDDRLDMTWSCTSRVDIADGETLKRAKRLGCWQVFYGVESGSQKILDFYDKRITVAQSARALEMTKDAGLHTKGFVIIGNPLETLETLEETRSFVLKAALDDISITYFTPYPGAAVFPVCERYGTFERDWERLSCFEIVFVPHGLSRPVLEDCQRRIFREFYYRPRVLLGYLGRIKTGRHLADLVGSGLALTKHVFVRPSPISYSIR
ncbi:MAG: cobalamin B12-binding domain-containing protein [Elusimicrobia bacterium]|nr:cobalamin B12-binding domain-containing protein [Elusimicrobiota bacterium]